LLGYELDPTMIMPTINPYIPTIPAKMVGTRPLMTYEEAVVLLAKIGS
jgi:hypothetical protein